MVSKFLLNALIFLLVIVGSMQLLFVQSRKFEKLYYEDSAYAWVNHLPVKPRIVLMGSSTMHNNVNAIELGSRLGLTGGEVVNYGQMTRGPINMYHLWNTLQPRRDSVKVVIMSLDPWIAYHSFDWIQKFPTLYWTPLQRLYAAIDPEYPSYVLSGSMVTDVAKKALVDYLKRDEQITEAPVGYGTETVNRRVKNFRSHAREYFGNTAIYPLSEIYIDRMAALKRSVEAQGAKFILMLPPKQSIWRNEYRTECADLDSELIAHLNRALGPTRVIGSFGLFAPQDDTLFIDHTHLDGIGQMRYTDSLAARLNEVLADPPQILRPLSSY